MTEPTIVQALHSLGFFEGWAANEATGLTVWERDEPEPSDADLQAAGWIPATEEPTE